MNEEPEIRYLGDLHRLELAPDDILVFRTPAHITDETAERIVASVKAQLGEDRKVIVLGGGAEIGVLAPTAKG